jgi:hypothetical protein
MSSTPSSGAALSPHNTTTKLDVGFYSPEARTSINRRVSQVSSGFPSFIRELPPMILSPEPLQSTYNRLGRPLADLSRSHPLTIASYSEVQTRLFLMKFCFCLSAKVTLIVVFLQLGVDYSCSTFKLAVVPCCNGCPMVVALCMKRCSCFG